MKENTMGEFSRRTFVGLMGSTVAVAGLGLVGCGGSLDTGSSDAGSAATGHDADKISVGASYATKNYHPSNTSSALALGTNWHVIEGLYGINFRDYRIHSELAVGDPKKIDDLTYEIAIRDGAKFSDGTDLTAEDVANSFTRSSDPEGIYAPMLTPIKSVEAKNNAMVIVRLKYPFSLLKERLAIVRVVPKDATDETLTAKPIGSGPWAYDEISETDVTAIPNDYYNGGFKTKNKIIHWQIMIDDTARTTAQTEGTTIIMENVPSESVSQVEAAGCAVDSEQGFGLAFLLFNTKKRPFDDARVRQACFYALNTDQMVSNTLSGQAKVATSYLAKNHANYHKAKLVYSYDVKKAKKLIEEADVTPGDIVINHTDAGWIGGLATQAQKDLSELGFNVSIKENQSAAMYSALDSDPSAFDMIIAPGDPSCFGNDPDLLMQWFYGANIWTKTRTQWSDSDKCKELQALMSDAVQKSGKDQQGIWNQCFDLLSEEVPLYPILHRKVNTGYYGDKIDGFHGISTTGIYLLGAATK